MTYKIANVIFACLIAVGIVFCIWLIRYDNSEVKRQNARLHAACGEMRIVKSFTDIGKAFVICAPEYISSPNDFVVREMK